MWYFRPATSTVHLNVEVQKNKSVIEIEQEVEITSVDSFQQSEFRGEVFEWTSTGLRDCASASPCFRSLSSVLFPIQDCVLPGGYPAQNGGE